MGKVIHLVLLIAGMAILSPGAAGPTALSTSQAENYTDTLVFLTWTDYITVFQSSPRKDLAAKFIDFLNRPEIAARNAELVYYATPNLAARAHLSKAYLDNTTIHPSETSLARSEVFRQLSPRTQKTINSVFAQLVN